MTNSRFSIDDLMIVDNHSSPAQRIYIRAILDSPSSEYRTSKVTKAQRVEIINELGLDVLTAVLAECFRRKGATYSAEQEAEFTWLMLNLPKNLEPTADL